MSEDASDQFDQYEEKLDELNERKRVHCPRCHGSGSEPRVLQGDRA